jgi:glycosyltransferase involved in cell wall biosynthesis
MTTPRVAVLAPCYNEAAAIGQVVTDFKAALPEATIYVYDNNSSDDTSAVARAAGAVVRLETMRGKGNVVRRMYADIEADVYVLVDGDDTYEAAAARGMVERLWSEHLDMINGRRITDIEAAYRAGHRLGNFGIETEMTVHALRLRMPLAEMPTHYKDRPAGSASKLRTYRDGVLILNTILALIRQERPIMFFGAIAALLTLVTMILMYPVVVEYIHTGLVRRFPTAILSTGIMLAAFLSLTSGVILDSVTRGRWEVKRLQYLALKGPGVD